MIVENIDNNGNKDRKRLVRKIDIRASNKGTTDIVEKVNTPYGTIGSADKLKEYSVTLTKSNSEARLNSLKNIGYKDCNKVPLFDFRREPVRMQIDSITLGTMSAIWRDTNIKREPTEHYNNILYFPSKNVSSPSDIDYYYPILVPFSSEKIEINIDGKTYHSLDPYIPRAWSFMKLPNASKIFINSLHGGGPYFKVDFNDNNKNTVPTYDTSLTINVLRVSNDPMYDYTMTG